MSRPPDSSSPLPSSTTSPSPSERATSASAAMFTIAARSFASAPSGRSGYSAVRHVGDDEAEHRIAQELEALVRHRRAPARTRYERCVSAASRSAASWNVTPRARRGSPAASSPRPRSTRRPARPRGLLDLDRLPAGVVAAVAADAVRELGLLALRALGVRGRLAFQFAARLSPRDLLCFFFGTAICRSFLVVRSGLSSRRASGASCSRPAQRGSTSSCPGHSPRLRSPPQTRAQALAVGPAQRRERQLDADRVADHLLGVERSPRGRAGSRRVVGLGLDHEQLVHLDGERAARTP